MTTSPSPLITIAVPSFNQGRFLTDALDSALAQDVSVEVYVADGGSTDESVHILEKFGPRLSGWRSHKDSGQAAAINECIAHGIAPYVCWLNSDDLLLPGSLGQLARILAAEPALPMAYGRSWNRENRSGKDSAAWVQPFSERRLAIRCIVSQPATLIRRSAWEAVGGLDENLQMAMDYDLWWRLYRGFGPPRFVDAFIAVNRDHDATKTRLNRRRHYREAMEIVRRHHGSVPLKWWLAQPYAVWYRSLFG